jgi:hypothetical protein
MLVVFSRKAIRELGAYVSRISCTYHFNCVEGPFKLPLL